MRGQKIGSVVNIPSLSGKSGNLGQTNCDAAKAGIVGLTKAADKEIAHHNVRVFPVQPGLIRTAMTAAMSPEVFAEREAAVPMKRASEPLRWPVWWPCCPPNCPATSPGQISKSAAGGLCERLTAH